MVKFITIATGLASFLAIVDAEVLQPRFAVFPKHIKKRLDPIENGTVVVTTTVIVPPKSSDVTTDDNGKTAGSGITLGLPGVGSITLGGNPNDDSSTSTTPTASDSDSTKSTTTSTTVSNDHPLESLLSSVLDPIVSPIVSIVDPILTPIVSAVDPIITPIVSAVEPIVSPIVSVVQPIVSPIVSAVDPIASPIESIASGIVSVVTSVVDPPKITKTPVTPSTTASVGGNPISTPSGPPDPIGSFLSSVISRITDPLPGPSTTPPPASQSSASSPPVILPPPGSIVSSLVSDVSSIVSSVGSGIVNPPPASSTPTSPISIPISTSVSSPSTSPTPPPPVSSSSIPSVNTSTDASTKSSNVVAPPPSSSTSTSSTSASEAVLPSSSVVPPPVASSSSSSAAASSIYPSTGPTTIVPTATDTLTSQFMPTSIISDTRSQTTLTSTGATDSGIPTSLPGQLSNPFTGGAMPPQQEGTTLVNFAFTRELDYDFVVSNQYAIKQIFLYTPKSVTYGLNMSSDALVQMQTLRPYDTSSAGYITTLALFYIPDDQVDVLQQQLVQANSWLHRKTPTDDPTAVFISLIDTTFPLRAANIDTGSGGNGGASPSGTSGSNPANLNSGGGSSSGSSVNPTAVGAGVGAVAGAALYGAIMFYVARRYRRRRAAHSRSSSIIDTASMAQSHPEMMTGAGTALMGGHEGYYGTNGRNSRGSGHTSDSRGRDISAPMMAENSLGWN